MIWIGDGAIPVQSFGSWALVGPPGVGKTTVAERVIGEYESISRGEMQGYALDEIHGVNFTHRFLLSPTAQLDRTLQSSRNLCVFTRLPIRSL